MNTGGMPRSSDSNSFPRRVTYHLSKTTHVQTRVRTQTTAEGRGGDRSLVAACTRLLLRFLLPVQGGAADVLGGLPAAMYT